VENEGFDVYLLKGKSKSRAELGNIVYESTYESEIDGKAWIIAVPQDRVRSNKLSFSYSSSAGIKA